MLPQSEQGPVTLEAVMGLLRDGAMRRFRIDIEADSTITGDESQEKQDRTAFLQSVTQFVTAWSPIIQASPSMVGMAGDLLLFGVRAFRVGRELEETIEETMDKIEEAASQPPPPNPQMEMEKVKADAAKTKAAADIEKTKLDMQATMMDHHVSMQQAAMDEQAAQNDLYRQQSQAAMQAMNPQAMPVGKDNRG